jgi:hypothetical protein
VATCRLKDQQYFEYNYYSLKINNMKKAIILTGIILTLFIVYSCGKKTFNEQIKEDVISKMGTGICDSIPSNSIISDVIIGEIVPIGNTGLTDVSIEFDYTVNNIKKHKKDALLYSKSGDVYTLEKIGGCEYSRK